jgi:hypothetical protein
MVIANPFARIAFIPRSSTVKFKPQAMLARNLLLKV